MNDYLLIIEYIEKYFYTPVLVKEFISEEFNFINIQFNGIISKDFYNSFKQSLIGKFGDIINYFEKIIGLQDTTIVVYVKQISEIRNKKISKIKNNLQLI
jgi:hypothetical protein